MSDYKLLGHDYTTPDLIAKVTGRAKYAEDYRAEGMLFATLLLSPRPPARVRKNAASAALDECAVASHGGRFDRALRLRHQPYTCRPQGVRQQQARIECRTGGGSGARAGPQALCSHGKDAGDTRADVHT